MENIIFEDGIICVMEFLEIDCLVNLFRTFKDKKLFMNYIQKCKFKLLNKNDYRILNFKMKGFVEQLSYDNVINVSNMCEKLIINVGNNKVEKIFLNIKNNKIKSLHLDLLNFPLNIKKIESTSLEEIVFVKCNIRDNYPKINIVCPKLKVIKFIYVKFLDINIKKEIINNLRTFGFT